MILQVFTIVFPLVLLVLVGYLYGRRHVPDMASANRLNLEVFTPALIFDVMSSKGFHLAEYQGLALACVVIVFGSMLIAWPVARLLGYQFKTFVPPMMFNNSGNMGLPLALFAFGEQALPAAVVLFVMMNLMHFSVGFKIMDPATPLLGLLRVPIVVATLLGLVVGQFGTVVPEVVAIPIEMLGQICIPLMLFSLGVRLITINWRDWRIGVVGAIVCPVSGILAALAIGFMLDLPPSQFSLLVVFGALPPAVFNFIVAERFQQEPQQVASIVMIGNLASIVIIPLVLAFVLTPV